MTTDKQDHNQASSPIEDRLRQALHTRAEQVQPSPEAFFTINRRISRREAASPWLPRSLWEKRSQLRLQPSTVLSLVLLVALTAVTTVLLTRGNSDPGIITTNFNATENPDGSLAPPTVGEPGTPNPKTTEIPLPTSTTPETIPGPQNVVTDPSLTTTTEQPTSTATTTPTATSSPDTAGLLEVRPLQVASQGFPQVFAEHRVDSEYLAEIRISSDLAFFKTTRLPALDSSGQQWIEVMSSADHNGEWVQGWVQSHTVSIQPQEPVSHSRGDLSAAAQTLVDFATMSSTPEVEAEFKRGAAQALPLSSRGIYISLADQLGTVYGYPRFAPDQVRNYLLNTSSKISSYELQTLKTTLDCLSQAQEADSAEADSAEAPTEPATADSAEAPTEPATADSAEAPTEPSLRPPGALHRLSYTTLTDGAACSMLVYFDFLQETPEIIAISIHNR